MEGKEIDRNSVPLKFEDIVDKKIYDKMRPPKPGGKINIINYLLDIRSKDSTRLAVLRRTVLCCEVRDNAESSLALVNNAATAACWPLSSARYI